MGSLKVEEAGKEELPSLPCEEGLDHASLALRVDGAMSQGVWVENKETDLPQKPPKRNTVLPTF